MRLQLDIIVLEGGINRIQKIILPYKGNAFGINVWKVYTIDFEEILNSWKKIWTIAFPQAILQKNQIFDNIMLAFI